MSSKATLIPSSKAPLTWQNFRFYTNSYAYLDDLAKHYGETFMLPLGGDKSSPYVFFSNPQDIRGLHSLDYGEFVMENSLLKAIFGNGSMLLINREEHKRDRKLLSPSLRGVKIDALGTLVYQRTIKVFEEIEVGETFVAGSVVRKILLYVIVEVVFGKQNDELYEEMHSLFTKLLTLITFPGDSLIFFDLLRFNLGGWSPWERLQECRQKIEGVLQREIDKRRQQERLDSGGILSLMLSNSK